MKVLSDITPYLSTYLPIYVSAYARQSLVLKAGVYNTLVNQHSPLRKAEAVQRSSYTLQPSFHALISRQLLLFVGDVFITHDVSGVVRSPVFR